MKTYRITATCNPYNARIHYNGGEVLRYDGATPVEWVHRDNLSYEEAVQQFKNWANEDCCWWGLMEIAEAIDAILEDGEISEYSVEEWQKDNRWWDGAGWYHCGSHEKCWDGCGNTYRDDVMTYHIEEC